MVEFNYGESGDVEDAENKALIHPNQRSTHIRLVEVLPLEPISSFRKPPISTKDANTAFLSFPLRLRLYSIPLVSLPTYKALSYTWGPPQRSQRISMNGKDVYVTPYLETALRYLRQPTEPLTIWIDQLCINQENYEEKNAQVPLMAEIYSRSEQVLIWLGPPADSSNELMDVFARVGKEAEDWGLKEYNTHERLLKLMKIRTKENPNDPKTISFHEMCMRNAPLFDLDAVRAWFIRPWFKRIWTVQEFCLGKDVLFVCGHKRAPIETIRLGWQIFEFTDRTVSWETLTAAQSARKLKELQVHHELFSLSPLTPLFSARNRKIKYDEAGGKGQTYLEILRTISRSSRLATDSRDTIYGLLALPKDAKDLGIRPDYKKGVKQVYIEFAQAVIRSGNLEILRDVRYPNSRTLPSWVPDWRCFNTPSFYERDINHDSPLFAAAGGTTPSILATHDEKELAVEGFLVDDVEEIGSPWCGMQVGTSDYLHFLAYFAQIKFMCGISAYKNNHIYPSAQRRAEAIWRIPVGDLETSTLQVQRRATEESLEGYRRAMAVWEHFQEMKLFNEAQLKDSLAILQRKEGEIVVRYRNCANDMKGRRPFLTKQGYVGVGPEFMKTGDVVVIILGLDMPMVLRPSGQDDKYILLGDVYCDGVMDGEIITQRSKQAFTII